MSDHSIGAALRGRSSTQGDSDVISPIMGVSPQVAIARLIPHSVRETFGLAGATLLGSVSEAGGITTTAFTGKEGYRIEVRTDGNALEVRGHVDERVAFNVGMRGRDSDGLGPKGRRSPLDHFDVNHEVANGKAHPGERLAEVWVYSYQVDRYLPPGVLRNFITNPDAYMFSWKEFEPETFFRLWLAAFESGNAPWQPAPPIKGFAEYFVNEAGHILTELGFHSVESVCGWFNDVKFFARLGYKFLDPGHGEYFTTLESALSQLELRECQRLGGERQFNDRHRAWWVALQNIPTRYLSHPGSPYFDRFGHYYLDGRRWFNSPSGSDWCSRMGKELNPFEWPG